MTTTQTFHSEPVNNRLSAKEREHLARIKEMDCAVCRAPGPSQAHHIEQGLQYTCIPLCPDCHTGSLNGIHGQKRMWWVMKLDELKALNATIERLLR